MYSLHTTPSWTNFKMQKYSISNVISLGISRNTLKILEYLLFSSLYAHFILYHWRKRWKIPKKILLALWNFTEIGNNFTLSLLVMLVTNINVTMSVTSEKCLRHLINVGSECQICCRIGQLGGLRNHYWVSDEGPSMDPSVDASGSKNILKWKTYSPNVDVVLWFQICWVAWEKWRMSDQGKSEW